MSSLNPSIRTVRCAFALLLGIAASTPVPAQQGGSPSKCQADGPVAMIPELSEASGIAVSRRVPGRLWAHNDSGQPVLFALDARGSVTGGIRLTGATVDDWEALAVGPCPAGSCVYVGDIGDNNARRKRVTIYRLPEPAGTDGSVAVTDIFHATYPDGAHDAEALLVTPDSRIFIVTKGDTGAVRLYRFPAELRAGATHQLELVGKPRGSGKPRDNRRVTDGSVSTDGQWTVLRTGERLTFHRTSELTAGNWRAARTADITAVGEPQGEGVAFGAGDMLYLAGEGGKKSAPGTLARVICPAGG